MKITTTITALFVVTSLASAIPADNVANAKYTTVCPYNFCFTRFGYKCNDKGKMTKDKSWEGCEVGCYCRKKSSIHEEDAAIE